MNRPSNAKYCPRCAVMNYADAPECRHCQHQFRMGAQTLPSENELNRTQMFLLPPLPPRTTDHRQECQRRSVSRAIRSWLALVQHSPLLWTAILLGFLISVIAWAAWKFGILGR